MSGEALAACAGPGCTTLVNRYHVGVYCTSCWRRAHGGEPQPREHDGSALTPSRSRRPRRLMPEVPAGAPPPSQRRP